MKIIDCLIYNNEIELLKARLDYLQDICDLHIIVEADNMLMILNKADEQNIKNYMFTLKEKSPGL